MENWNVETNDSIGEFRNASDKGLIVFHVATI